MRLVAGLRGLTPGLDGKEVSEVTGDPQLQLMGDRHVAVVVQLEVLAHPGADPAAPDDQRGAFRAGDRSSSRDEGCG